MHALASQAICAHVRSLVCLAAHIASRVQHDARGHLEHVYNILVHLRTALHATERTSSAHVHTCPARTTHLLYACMINHFFAYVCRTQPSHATHLNWTLHARNNASTTIRSRFGCCFLIISGAHVSQRFPCVRRQFFLFMDAPVIPGSAALLCASGWSSHQPVELQWLAWITDDSSTIRWELRRVLPSVGYPEKKSVLLKDYVRDMLPGWRVAWASLQLPLTPGFGRPSSSHDPTSPAHHGENFEESEYWMDTDRLLVALLFWWNRAKVSGDRTARASCALRLMLEKIIDPDAVLAHDAMRWREEHLALCQLGNQRGACMCVGITSQKLDMIRAQRHAPHDMLRYTWKELYLARECPAVAAQLAMSLRVVADSALQSFNVWGDKDIGQANAIVGPSSKKRRRISSRMKEYLAGTRVGEDTEITVRKKDKDLLPKVKTEAMRWQLASNWLSLPCPTTLGSTFDAGRVGRPAKELLLHLGYLPRLRRGIPLPPRVR